jgi:hypothetical protein
VREMRNTHKIVIGKPEGKEHSDDLGVHKAVPLHATEALGGRDVYLLLILDLGTIWGLVVSVTPRSRFAPVK